MNCMISVVIPVYNVKEYLDECINSVINQTYACLEIILVDDGSTDGSSEICDKYGHLDERILVIHQENGGLSCARNTGIEHASGEYISFIDSDDYIELDTYEKLLSLNTVSNADVICMARKLKYNDKIKIVNKREFPILIDSREYLRLVFTDNGVDMSVCDKLFKIEVFENVRFPIGYLCEDSLVLMEIIKNINSALLTGIPLYIYRQRTGSITKVFDKKMIDTYRAYDVLEEKVCLYYPELLQEFTICKNTLLVYIYFLYKTDNVNVDASLLEEAFNDKSMTIILNKNYSTGIRAKCIFIKLNMVWLYNKVKRLANKLSRGI